MELNNSYRKDFLNTKGASELYQERAKQAAKRVELERYFPGLSSEQGSSLKKGEGTKIKSDFASQLESRIKQKSLTRAEIQEEIKSDPEKNKLYQAALDFQALFIGRMLTAMRKNLNPKDDLLHGGFRQKVFEDMLYEEYSSMLSRTDDFGIADDIYRQGRERI